MKSEHKYNLHDNAMQCTTSICPMYLFTPLQVDHTLQYIAAIWSYCTNIMFIFCKWIWKYGCMHLQLWNFQSQITIDTPSFSFQRIKTLQMLIKFLFPIFHVSGMILFVSTIYRYLVSCQTMGRWVLWNVNKGWDEGIIVTANLSLCPIAHQWLICEGW